jgi:hypothetical protein
MDITFVGGRVSSCSHALDWHLSPCTVIIREMLSGWQKFLFKVLLALMLAGAVKWNQELRSSQLLIPFHLL